MRKVWASRPAGRLEERQLGGLRGGQRDRTGAGEARAHQAHQRNGRAAPEVTSTRPNTPQSGHGANQRATGAHRTRGTGAPAGDEGGHEGQRTAELHIRQAGAVQRSDRPRTPPATGSRRPTPAGPRDDDQDTGHDTDHSPAAPPAPGRSATERPDRMAARRAKAEADDSDSKPATSTQAAPERPGRTSTEDSDPHEKATKAAERGEKATTGHPLADERRHQRPGHQRRAEERGRERQAAKPRAKRRRRTGAARRANRAATRARRKRQRRRRQRGGSGQDHRQQADRAATAGPGGHRPRGTERRPGPRPAGGPTERRAAGDEGSRRHRPERRHRPRPRPRTTRPPAASTAQPLREPPRRSQTPTREQSTDHTERRKQPRHTPTRDQTSAPQTTRDTPIIQIKH